MFKELEHWKAEAKDYKFLFENQKQIAEEYRDLYWKCMQIIREKDEKIAYLTKEYYNNFNQGH